VLVEIWSRIDATDVVIGHTTPSIHQSKAKDIANSQDDVCTHRFSRARKKEKRSVFA